MARIPLAVTLVVSVMVTAFLIGCASAAASRAPGNRGWLTGDSGADATPAGRPRRPAPGAARD